MITSGKRNMATANAGTHGHVSSPQKGIGVFAKSMNRHASFRAEQTLACADKQALKRLFTPDMDDPAPSIKPSETNPPTYVSEG